MTGIPGKRRPNLQKIRANREKAAYLEKLNSGLVSVYGGGHMFRWLLKKGYVTRSRKMTDKGKRFCKRWALVESFL